MELPGKAIPTVFRWALPRSRKPEPVGHRNNIGVVGIFKESIMTKLYTLLQSLKNDETAQDMVENALLAGFIAVVAGATLPGIADSLNLIFNKMASVTSVAAAK
jgi:Flp pilus assembly pilin Flp